MFLFLLCFSCAVSLLNNKCLSCVCVFGTGGASSQPGASLLLLFPPFLSFLFSFRSTLCHVFLLLCISPPLSRLFIQRLFTQSDFPFSGCPFSDFPLLSFVPPFLCFLCVPFRSALIFFFLFSVCSTPFPFCCCCCCCCINPLFLVPLFNALSSSGCSRTFTLEYAYIYQPRLNSQWIAPFMLMCDNQSNNHGTNQPTNP